MADNLVKFVATTALAYASASNLDENTLYFITDERRIYKGSVPYSGGIYKEVDSIPANPEVNVLYCVKATGRVVFYDGSKTVLLVAPRSTSLGASSTDSEVATAKSVVSYVSSAVSALGVDKINSQVATNKSNISTLQSSVSTLTGSGTGSVAKALSDAKSYTDSAKTALQTNINKKANSATSLAGYGISDAYTKTQVDSAISSAVANAHHLKREIVASLPAVDKANADTIYMVPTSGSTTAAGSTASAYIEYMLINGGFERIGTSDVDLSNYATKGEVSTAKTAAINSAASDATTKANNALSSAKSYADGLAKNYATAAQGAKADSALQAANIVESSNAGKITVKGTDVAIHGLGSAAYTASTAYATAAQGTKADSALQSANIATGTSNGTISVKGTNVAVKGLGSAAYTASTAYATAAQGTKADSALQSANIATGTSNGTISVKGTNVAVKGLGSAAYTASTAYATAAQGTKADSVYSAITWGTI